VSPPEPNPGAPNRHSPQGQTADDARVAEDLVRAALSQLGNDFKFPRAKPSPDDLAPSEGVAERSKPAAVPQTPNASRERFGIGPGAFVIAYATFPALMAVIFALFVWDVRPGTDDVSTGQHKLARVATVADSALSLTEERDDDRRLAAENTGTHRQPQVSPPALVKLTADDLSPPSRKAQPFVVALRETLPRSAPELAPPQDAKLEPTPRTQSTAETNPPATPVVATVQPPEADPVQAPATSPIDATPPALIEARQPGFPTPKQDTHEFREQGKALLARGDIVSARRLFEYAANRGDTAAATQAGKTYDPDFLRRAGARSIPSDSDKATYWYRQAAGNGDPEAAANLKRLSLDEKDMRDVFTKFVDEHTRMATGKAPTPEQKNDLFERFQRWQNSQSH